MRPSSLLLVADIAEENSTFFACQQVLTTFLPIETAAFRALAAESDINVGVILATDVFLNQLQRNFDWLLVTFVTPMTRVFLEVLLTLGSLYTNPAEPCITLCALDLGATAANQSNSGTTF